jgi:hypothetical protein
LGIVTHPYAGTQAIIETHKSTVRGGVKFSHDKREMTGHNSAPDIPHAIPITDMNAREAGSICSSVLENNTAVEVTVAILRRALV